ncbi:thioredoxin, putative [Bodo saltans]|uniref:Thioredoxin, putative n=1 Tax=Bodo saltans TaxID=75058 RepID=A0A0S4J6N7_BODSA|nr:thioredoxin, putative [Bodo saltans]|eukprot:CUG85174.1 thioredoxin, putative [Bodo saltans]
MKIPLRLQFVTIFVTIFVVFATLLPSAVTAFPFSASSGVTELTPKNLNGFLNTHKPVFIVFYAPWCGHCKSIHPEWEKFAKSVKDVVRVGAINADQHRELGSQFGVQGFPTIKYWKMGNKKGMKPSDYQQGRTSGALQSAALAEINNKGVTNVADEAAVIAALKKSSSGKSVILFSSKNKSPPLFSVMAQSPHFQSKLAFLLATSSAKALATSLGVTKFPTVVVVTADESAKGFSVEQYTGSIEYTSIAKYLQAAIGGAAAEGGEEPAADGAKKEEAKKTATPEEAAAAAPKAEPSKPKAAHPVRPVPLVPAMFAPYCAQGSQKIRGQPPLCVVSFAKETSLDDLFNKYGNEAFLFFDGTATSEHTRKEFVQQLGLSSLNEGDAVLVRAFKAEGCKHAVVAGATNEALDLALQKAVNGELTMKKSDVFVALTAPTDEA